jgi:hypothetical protein
MKHIQDFEAFLNENKLNEGNVGDYYDTVEEAMDDVYLGVEAEDLTIDEKDWAETLKAASKPLRPGETFETSIKLYNKGRQTKQMVHIQIHNQGTGARPFELEYHIS